MWQWIKALDRVLRGDATRMPALRAGTIEIPVVGLCVVITFLGLFAGSCIGWFALFNRTTPVYMQAVASAVKVPLLFLATLIVTFPSLYVFNALVGSRLRFGAVLRLLIAATAVTMAVLASLGPITAFFSVSTESYSFMVLLNVLVFGVAGLLGLVFMLQTLHRLSLFERAQDFAAAHEQPTPDAQDDDEAQAMGNAPGALDTPAGHVLGSHVKTVFRCWMVIFALVGAQMGWVLRPFVGNPNLPFAWFRPRESNFFEALFNVVGSFFS